MTRTLVRPLLLPLLVLGLAACGSKPIGPTTGGHGGAPATGSAGSMGSGGSGGGEVGVAGATGSGGEGANAGNGAAGDPAPGSAGTPGTAGKTGAAGTTEVGPPDAGAGPDASPVDAESNLEGGTPMPRYTGGIVSVINSSNWNETTIHPFNKRRMLVRDAGDSHVVLLDFALTNPVVWRTVSGPWARAMQLIGNNQVLGGRNDGYEVFDLADGHIVKQVKTYANTQSVTRLANGETMLTRSGTKLDFLDKSDQIAHSISYPGYAYVRIARPTRNGTFLVPSDTTLFEGDDKGNVLWTTTETQWAHIWEAQLTSDGNALVGAAFASSLDVVDKTTHKVGERFGTKAMPNAAVIRPNVFTEFQILPNGNLITANWQGAGRIGGIQVLEFNPAGELVWFYMQDPNVFSGIQGVQVIDGMDPRFLHVLEISADGTWQPVFPTRELETGLWAGLGGGGGYRRDRRSRECSLTRRLAVARRLPRSTRVNDYLFRQPAAPPTNARNLAPRHVSHPTLRNATTS
jgi:hypothetical protein